MTQRPATFMRLGPPRSGTGRIVVCASTGALAVALALVFSQGYRWVHRSAEGGGVAHNLVWLALMMADTLFRAPWGALGALVGAGIGWLTLAGRRPGSVSPTSV